MAAAILERMDYKNRRVFDISLRTEFVEVGMFDGWTYETLEGVIVIRVCYRPRSRRMMVVLTNKLFNTHKIINFSHFSTSTHAQRKAAADRICKLSPLDQVAAYTKLGWH